MNPAVLAIDLGSSTVKAAVVDHSGALRGTGAGTIDLLLGDGGAAEQSPDQLWSAVMGACRQAIDASHRCGDQEHQPHRREEYPDKRTGVVADDR